MSENTRTHLSDVTPCTPVLLIAGGLGSVFFAAANGDWPAAWVGVSATVVGVGSVATDLASDFGNLKKTHLATIFASLALAVTSVSMSLGETPEEAENGISKIAIPGAEVVKPELEKR